jgi:poly-gamma-glutamate synthesis protein (capsule biosynthesis protein)
MKIILAGDFCPHYRVERIIEDTKYEKILGDVKPIIESADYSLVNFECPVVENTQAKPIEKCGPNLRCTRKAVDAIKYAGFKGVTLANNHVMDFGKEGLNDTITVCQLGGLDMVGVGRDIKEASNILYKKIENKTIAFINCCEHEFSIATTFNPGANPLNPVQQYYAIQEAQKQADSIIVIVHGGHEHYQLPSPRMKELYRYFIDCGADAVINHHQHCFSGYEVYQGRPIFYGLGNFCFDWDGKHKGTWTEGYMVQLIMPTAEQKNRQIDFELIPYVQCGENVSVQLMQDKKKDAFLKQIESLNATIVDDNRLSAEHKKWMDTTGNGYELTFSPYSNRWLRAACVRGLLPKFISKQKRNALINYIDCESHRDRVLFWLKK